MPNVSTSLLSFVKPCHHCLKIISKKKKKKKKKKFQIFFPKNSDDVIKHFDFFSKNFKHFDSLTFWPSLKTIGLLEQQLV